MANPDFNIWYKSRKESFLYINERSNIKDAWLDYSEVLSSKYKDLILKPINKYVQNLYQPPSLIEIKNGNVILEQSSFAEIMLLQKNGQSHLTAMEKIHMRQFYLSDKELEEDAECFNTIYRLFVPWIVDIPNLNISIEPIDNSAFKIIPQQITSLDYNKMDRVDPEMLTFRFKKMGDHMIDSEYGKILRYTPMFRMIFPVNDIMVKRIEEFYVNH